MSVDFGWNPHKMEEFSMTIHWSLLGPGLLLLLFPADRLLSSTVVLRSFESFRTLEDSPRHRPWWWVPVLWIDPIRGLVGTLLVKQALAIVSEEWALVPLAAYWSMTVILGLAVLAQIFTRRDRDVLLAPIGFVAGVVAALIPWPVAGIAFPLAFAGLFGFRSFHAFFSVGLAAIAIIGFALRAKVAWVAPAVGVLSLPIIAGFLARATLELPTRNPADPLAPRRRVP